nr:immunoglobulin heavy chain junction region [Macaca mulatta]
CARTYDVYSGTSTFGYC